MRDGLCLICVNVPPLACEERRCDNRKEEEARNGDKGVERLKLEPAEVEGRRKRKSWGGEREERKSHIPLSIFLLC